MPFSPAILKTSSAPQALLHHVAALAPGLAAGAPPPVVRVLPDCRDALVRRGHARLGTAPLAVCEPLRDVVDALVAESSPGVLVYLLDAIWQLGAAVCAAASEFLGGRYVLAADAWAWSIPPGRGRGWAPHRGVDTVLLDRARPEVVNVWVALSDARRERACMHAIDLDHDPGYPSDLARVDAAPEHVVPLPVEAGAILMWNANVLHWGGACEAHAVGPRTSCSFTLLRQDAVERIGGPLADELDRLTLVAAQIATYGHGQPDISPEFSEWARATLAYSRVRKDG